METITNVSNVVTVAPKGENKMNTIVNETNMNQTAQAVEPKKRKLRRSRKEVYLDKINNHLRIIPKYEKRVKKWTEEIRKTQGTIENNRDKLATCKPEEKEHYSVLLVKRTATLEKKMDKLEKAKARLAKKQASAKELFVKLNNSKYKVIFEELRTEHRDDVEKFESYADGGKALDIEEIVSNAESVVDACLNITTAPNNNVTDEMMKDLTDKVNKTISHFEVNEEYDAPVADKAA